MTNDLLQRPALSDDQWRRSRQRLALNSLSPLLSPLLSSSLLVLKSDTQ
jgi:hypothetical protein